MMGLRKVRNEVTTVRKEGVARNGSEKVFFYSLIPVKGTLYEVLVLLLRLQPNCARELLPSQID